MNKYFTYFILSLIFTCTETVESQDSVYSSPGMMNPVVPGYFADPTVIKIGDTYYMYATTDGVRLASGEPQVWISKDFVNWYNQEIDIPYSLTNVWAPDLVVTADNKYYYSHGNCEDGCNIYEYVAETPLGPWTNIAGKDKPAIPVNLVGTLPSLDQHYFVDEDGSIYVFFGTWINYNGGLGWAKIDPADMITILDKGQIPMEQLPDIFEAPYMLKKNNKYILMYSSGDVQASSYRVQYSYADSPTGPFTYGKNNPILSTTADGYVDSPGHHCVIRDGEDYYIVYHRHDNPHSSGGEFRQLCIDSLIFENDSTIRRVIPTHKGIGYLSKNQVTVTDQAFGATAIASSYYHLIDEVNDYVYYPKFATDNNNGTMWRAGTNDLPQSLIIDMGKEVNVKRIMTQFEYSTYYYQYLIEYSSDSSDWKLYVDRTDNRASGSPMIDDGDVTGRYIRITITGTEKTGQFAAIWNIKIYSKLFEVPDLESEISDAGPGVKSTKSLLVELNVTDLSIGEIDEIPNKGILGGIFIAEGNPQVESHFNVKAVTFDGNDYLKLTEKAPLSLSWNSSFTVSAWVLNPEVADAECIVTWSKLSDNLMGEYVALMYGRNEIYGAVAHWGRLDMPYNKMPEPNTWKHITLTFDGMIERVYVDSILDNQSQKNLFIHPECDIVLGYPGDGTEYFDGSIASLRIYDKCFPADSIGYLMRLDKLDIDYDTISEVPKIQSIEKY